MSPHFHAGARTGPVRENQFSREKAAGTWADRASLGAVPAKMGPVGPPGALMPT